MAFTFKNKIPSVRFEGSNEEKRRNRNKKDVVVSKRLVVLIGMVVTLSILLVARLAYIQLTQGDLYAVKLDKYGTVKYTSEAPRGEIVDRNGVKLVKNINIINATYYAPKSITTKEIELTANFLVANVEMDTSGINERQKKDYFMMACEKIAEGLVSTEERKALQAEDNATKMIENLTLQRITEELMNEHMDETLLKKTRLIYLMSQCTSGAVVLIEGINADYASIIGQNKSLLKGVSVTTDWSREYVNGANFARVLGKVTTKKQGLPSEQQAELLTLGYQNDSRVGTIGLEQQYESLLRGTETTYSVNYDTDGNPIISNSVKGVAGSTLRLSIDWELQQYADLVIEEELKACNNLPDNQYFDRIFLILMDPNNGDIIVMSGKQIDKKTGEVSDFSAGNYTVQQLIGSTTKGGTIYAGFKLELINPETRFIDEPVLIKGTEPKKSSRNNLGNLNAVDSLVLSSNVYMFRVAMLMGGHNYIPGNSLSVNLSAFETYRQCIGELGLGVKTGLDVTDESIGLRGSREAGKLLDLSIGQYDAYTNIQLAQYTATLANRGKRIQPRLLLDASNIDSSGDSVTTFEKEVKILDDVSDQELAFEQIHQGFRGCVERNDGLCKSMRKNYTVSAKTGTAEFIDYKTNKDYPNNLMVGWASEENPQVVFSVFCYRQNRSSQGGSGSSSLIAGLVMDKYHEKYGIK